MITDVGVRTLKENPSFLAPLTKAPSSKGNMRGNLVSFDIYKTEKEGIKKGLKIERNEKRHEGIMERKK